MGEYYAGVTTYGYVNRREVSIFHYKRGGTYDYDEELEFIVYFSPNPNPLGILRILY
jgi:hypothetical protein